MLIVDDLGEARMALDYSTHSVPVPPYFVLLAVEHRWRCNNGSKEQPFQMGLVVEESIKLIF